jgi:hypothetical protein
MDEMANGTCAGGLDICDHSGNENHGDNIGATWQTGTAPTRTTTGSGQAATFDGVNDYIITSSDGMSGNMPEITLSAWIYPTDFDHANYPHILNNNANILAFHLLGPAYGANKGKVGFYMEGGGGRACEIYASNSYLTLNNWQHVVVNCDLDGSSFYINGNLDKSVNSGIYASGVPSFSKVIIGGTHSFSLSSNKFRGQIDDVRIYNRALSEDEVKYLYETTYRE